MNSKDLKLLCDKLTLPYASKTEMLLSISKTILDSKLEIEPDLLKNMLDHNP